MEQVGTTLDCESDKEWFSGFIQRFKCGLAINTVKIVLRSVESAKMHHILRFVGGNEKRKGG